MANLKLIDPKHRVYAPDYELSVAYVKTTILELLGVKLPKNYKTFLESSEFKGYASSLNLYDANVHILMIVDTIGLEQLETCLPNIAMVHRKFGGFVLSSVFPTVTSSVLTSIYTGKQPFNHGIVGHKIFFKEIGSVLNTLEYTAGSGRDLLYKAGVNARALMWADRLSDMFSGEVEFIELSHSHILNTGLSRFLYENVTCYGYQTVIDGFSKLAQIAENVKDRKSVITFYLGDFDHLGHVYGPHSWEYGLHASYFENAFIKTVRRLRELGGVVLSFISDHGGVSLGKIVEFGKSELDRIRELTGMRVGKSGRILHFYLSNVESKEDLVELLESKVAQSGLLVPYRWLKKHGIIRKNVVGDEELRIRIGDYLLIASPNISFRFEPKERSGMLKPEMGGHGGLTPEELLVPYFIAPIEEIARHLEA